MTLNGEAISERSNRAAFEAGGPGWLNAGRDRILARSGKRPVAEDKVFDFDRAPSADLKPTAGTLLDYRSSRLSDQPQP